MNASTHYSVLLKESVDALVVDPDGCYVDGTFGRGGHSREILSRLSERGCLLVFDKDPDAIVVAHKLADEDKRVCVLHGSFADLRSVLPDSLRERGLDGVLLDLGVSSPQLDTAERGFSFTHDGPLDMRMDSSQGQTAAQWLNSASAEGIATVLKEYGEERFAKRMAAAVIKRRETKPLQTTKDFADVISAANPRWEKGKHPATRAFQAVRIFINRELEDLATALEASLAELNPGGRMVVISFHSLEDRIVKRFFREQAKGRSFPAGLPVTEAMLAKTVKIVGKAIRASDDELSENVRSRSAVMRVAERLPKVEG